MSGSLAVMVALGAAAGAPVRYWLAHVLDERWPTGTLLVNVLGSGLIGVLGPLALGEVGWALSAVGFCGALTSFSSFAVQAVDAPRTRGTSYVVTTVVLSLGACALGWVLGSSL